MPCVQISTNVCLDGLDTDPIFSEVTKVVSQIIGRGEEVSIRLFLYMFHFHEIWIIYVSFPFLRRKIHAYYYVFFLMILLYYL